MNVTPSASIVPIRIAVGRKDARRIDSLSGEMTRELTAAFREWAQDLQAYTDQVNNYMPEDLAAALVPTMELACLYCPKDTGALVASAYLNVAQRKSGGAVVTDVEMGFGANNEPPYAIYVHEIPQAYHEPPTRYKWMQAALDEDYFSLLNRIVENVRIRMGLS